MNNTNIYVFDTAESLDNDLDVLRTVVAYRRVEAKRMFAINQAKFIESRAKFINPQDNHIDK